MARQTGKYNVNVCQFCGCTNDEMGERYWVDTECSICSGCAPGRGVKIVRNKYTRPAANYGIDGKRLCDPVKQAAANKSRRRALVNE